MSNKPSDTPRTDAAVLSQQSGALYDESCRLERELAALQPCVSLRDYFAGKALQMIVINDVSGRPENFHDHYSEGAYKWADAMLRARRDNQP